MELLGKVSAGLGFFRKNNTMSCLLFEKGLSERSISNAYMLVLKKFSLNEKAMKLTKIYKELA